MTATTTTTGAPPVPPATRRSGGGRLPTIRYTLAQMRRSAGRLTAAGIAILIGTAFVTATLIAGDVVTRTVYDTTAARYADADVVVTLSGDTWKEDLQAAQAVQGVDGVTATQVMQTGFIDVSANGERAYPQMFALPNDSRLNPLHVVEGTWPDERGKVAIPSGLAERMKLGVGDTISVTGWNSTREALVSGVTEDRYKAFAATGGSLVVMPGDYTAWMPPSEADPSEVEVSAVLDESVMSGDEPTDALREAVVAAAGSAGGGVDATLRTVDERAAEITAAQTGDQNLVFLVFVLTFAAVALVVAGLVIANTFQVLVAQRTRTLALLRCIGAGRGQLYRSTLFEALVLGTLASLGGIVTGVLLTQIGLWAAPQFDIGVPLPSMVALTPQVVLLPLVLGVVVTVVAALAPARNATRVAPLAALRPAATLSLRKGVGRARAVFAVLFLLAGIAGLVLSIRLGLDAASEFAVLLAVAGGTSALIGVIVGAVFWLPKVAAFAGRLAGPTGPAARLAAANTLRNPRRTSATATALLIGVTLIMTMATGAAAARATSTQTLNASFPMDVIAQSGAEDITGDTAQRIASTEAVTGVAEIMLSDGEIGGQEYVQLKAGDPEALRNAVRDPAQVDRIQDGTIVVAEDRLEAWAEGGLPVEPGQTIDVKGPDTTLTLTVEATDSPGYDGFVTVADMDKLDGKADLGSVWAAFDQGTDPAAALAQVQDAVGDDGLMVTGLAAERASFEQVINVMLGVIVGLLAVAVVIAVIGVTNTLSLSVIERRRENATLRAIGLSRSQLRGMLAVEGVLIALVGAVVGIVLGLAFGWAGAAATLSAMGDVQYIVPWAELAVVLVIAVLAGLIASVAPARTALKASPVEALAAD